MAEQATGEAGGSGEQRHSDQRRKCISETTVKAAQAGQVPVLDKAGYIGFALAGQAVAVPSWMGRGRAVSVSEPQDYPWRWKAKGYARVGVFLTLSIGLPSVFPRLAWRRRLGWRGRSGLALLSALQMFVARQWGVPWLNQHWGDEIVRRSEQARIELRVELGREPTAYEVLIRKNRDIDREQTRSR